MSPMFTIAQALRQRMLRGRVCPVAVVGIATTPSAARLASSSRRFIMPMPALQCCESPLALRSAEERFHHRDGLRLVLAADVVSSPFDVHDLSARQPAGDVFVLLPEISLRIGLENQRRRRDLREQLADTRQGGGGN